MTIHLDTRQKNNLIVGNELAAEISAANDDFRAFVSISAYLPSSGGGLRPSKMLNAANQDQLRFWLRKYEIHKDYIKNMWDIAENDLINSYFIDEIASLEELEVKLREYLEDFSLLGLNSDSPI